MKKAILLSMAIMASSVVMGQGVKLSASQDLNAMHQQRQMINIDPIQAQRGIAMPKAEGATQDYITEQPEGELKTYVRSGENMTAVMGGIVDGSQAGRTMNIVFAPDGKTVWFDKMISATTATFGWIKGEIEGDKIVIEPGQYAWYYDYGTYYTAYSVERIVPNPDGNATNYDTYLTAEGNIEFAMGEDGSLTLLPGEDGVAAIGLIRRTTDEFLVEYGYDGKWLGYGDQNTVYTPFEANFNEGPAEGTELQDFAMTYDLYVGSAERSGHLTKGAIVGDKIYIQGASQYMKDAWLVGTIEGNKVTVDKQLAGILDGYYTYFVGGEIVSQYNEETQQDEYFYAPIEQMTFDYNAETRSLTSNDCLLVAASENLFAEGYMKVAFNPYEDVAAQPATPVVGEDFLPYDTESGSCFVTVYVPSEDVNGNYIDGNKLTYSVYIDDELFTFDPSFYFYFSNPTTVIDFGYYEDYRFQNLGAGRIAIEINKEPLHSIGVKSFYAGGGETTESDMGMFYLNMSGISDIQGKAVSKITYYNLAGQSSNRPFSGMNIVVTTHTDGTTSTAKVIK